MHASQYHVFSIPPDILSSLVTRTCFVQNPSPSPSPAAAVSSIQSLSKTGTRACNVCNATDFDDVEDQRAHFRSDWHRYNVKIRFNGGRPVAESDFAVLLDELQDSLSGSASSDDDETDDPDAISALVRKVKITPRDPSPTSHQNRVPKTPLVWFHSPPSTQIGVYKALFAHQADDDKSYIPELQALQTPKDRTWAMFMTAGGHFAGAIVRVSRREDDIVDPDKKRSKRPKPDTEVLRHKTFHRYTTRRKQGGSQSANDNAKGNAKSAGAQLRRYGEQSLRDDIQQLLHEWADDIADCERIWIRANVSNKRIFFEANDTIIAKGDIRLRSFPFPTRRPTQSELSRCLLELTRVKTSYFTEDDLRAQDEAYMASLPKPKPKPVVPTPDDHESKPRKLSKEEEALREKWARLVEMVKKGRLDSLATFWARESEDLGGVSAPTPDHAGESRRTLLQIAAAAGHENVVTWLLESAHADPTVEVPPRNASENDPDDENQSRSDFSDSPRLQTTSSRRTAYDLAKTRSVRNAFRRCAAAYPDWWDWFGAARVPSALNPSMEDQQDDKKKVRRKMLKDRVRVRETRERENEKDTVPPIVTVSEDVPAFHGPRKLGGSGGGSDDYSGLTPEMRMRIERERRARAAEARMQTKSSVP